MSVDPRLTRLRTLIDRLERLPASARRDWMLVEARARIVDVETDVAPRAMRALETHPTARAPEPRGTPTANGRASKRPTSSDRPAGVDRGRAPRQISPAERPRPRPEPAPVDASAATLGTDGLLWLEDLAADMSAEQGDGSTASAPWRRGLRG